jgi:mannose-6-phosphate isomerase
MDLLTNPIRVYDWGSTTAIPELLDLPPDGTSQAELWMGAHERAPSSVVRGDRRIGLDEVIAADPLGEVGSVGTGSPRLPFMAKVLAVDEPLSLQVHPGAEQAALGYAREERAGLAMHSGLRSYPDPLAKPELILALSEYSLVCGLATPADALELLDALRVPQLQPMVDQLEVAGTDGVLRALATTVQLAVDTAERWIGAARPAAERLVGHERWRAVAGAFLELAKRHPDDRAVLATLLLRAHVLSPGEALFVPPGQPHCHLSGLGFEVLANSDNIVRYGLTGKHTDPDHWLDLVAGSAELRPDLELRGEPAGAEIVYAPPAAEFALGVVADVAATTRLADAAGPQLLFCLTGGYELSDGASHLSLSRGQASFVPARAEFVEASGSGTLLRVTARRPPPAVEYPEGRRP